MGLSVLLKDSGNHRQVALTTEYLRGLYLHGRIETSGVGSLSRARTTDIWLSDDDVVEVRYMDAEDSINGTFVPRLRGTWAMALSARSATDLCEDPSGIGRRLQFGKFPDIVVLIPKGREPTPITCQFQKLHRGTIIQHVLGRNVSLHMVGEIGRHIQPGGGDCDECRALIRALERIRSATTTKVAT